MWPISTVNHSSNWKSFMLHDNARLHTTMIVKCFLAQHRVTELFHPPYSPDLLPADFSLNLKSLWKGKDLKLLRTFKPAVTRELKAVLLGEFSRAFDDLHTCCQRCIWWTVNSFHMRSTQCLTYFIIHSTYWSHFVIMIMIRKA